MVSAFGVVSASGYGGNVSEKLLERSGVGSSLLLIDHSGTQNSDLDVAMGAIVSTLPASNIGTLTAVLNGNLTDLNGMPEAFVCFEWGYGTYSYTTAQQSLSAVGGFWTTISGFDVSETIIFRAVALTDGTAYGSMQSFEVGTFRAAHDLLSIIIPMILVALLVATLMKTGMDWRILLFGVMGIVLSYLATRAILG